MLFVVCCELVFLFVVARFLFARCCGLVVVVLGGGCLLFCCSFVVCCASVFFVVRCSLFVVCCLLFVVHSCFQLGVFSLMMFVDWCVCYLLFVVCW